MTAFRDKTRNIQYAICNIYTWHAWKKINSRKYGERERKRFNNKYMKQVIQLVEFAHCFALSLSLRVSWLDRSDLHMPLHIVFFCPVLVLVHFPFNWKKTSSESSWFNIFYMRWFASARTNSNTHQICICICIRIESSDTLCLSHMPHWFKEEKTRCSRNGVFCACVLCAHIMWMCKCLHLHRHWFYNQFFESEFMLKKKLTTRTTPPPSPPPPLLTFRTSNSVVCLRNTTKLWAISITLCACMVFEWLGPNGVLGCNPIPNVSVLFCLAFVVNKMKKRTEWMEITLDRCVSIANRI